MEGYVYGECLRKVVCPVVLSQKYLVFRFRMTLLLNDRMDGNGASSVAVRNETHTVACPSPGTNPFHLCVYSCSSMLSSHLPDVSFSFSYTVRSTEM